MKRPVIASLLVAASGIACAGSPAAPNDRDRPPPPQLFTYESIPAPAGYYSIRLTAINDLGDTAGVVQRHYRYRDFFVVIRHADGSYAPIPIPRGATRQDFVTVVALNRMGQMLAYVNSNDWQFYDPRHGWKHLNGDDNCAVSTAAALNNRGDVVGTCIAADGRRAGFIWNREPGVYRAIELGASTSFADINDDLQIAATVTGPDGLSRPRGSLDQTAALVRQDRSPVYTGDLVIHDLAAYEDPANANREVWSASGAIATDGALGVSVTRPDAGRSDRYTACVWQIHTGFDCSPPPSYRPKVIGFGPRHALIYSERGHPQSYAFLPSPGVNYTLPELSGGSEFERYGANGVNKLGEVVGTPTDRGNRSSFILHPIQPTGDPE